ncbi:MAG: undecaprenyl-diphosphatase UppP [Chthonomonas sp.]|nr:undecaprenyl-diphosphatase UppP [Chthonomonas sp.]
MGIVEAVVLGIIQGVTEWLPISSTAHLRLAPLLFGWSDPGAGFTAVIQLGTLAAILIYFWGDLTKVFLGWLGSLTDKSKRGSLEAKQGWAIFIGTLPIVVLGKLFEHQIKGPLRSLTVIATSLIVVGILLFIAERVSRKKLSMEDVTPMRGLWVGLWQAVALIPGASRSGSTITGGLLAGFDRKSAARFSFLLSVPSILAAGIKEVFDARDQLVSLNVANVGVATVVSFVVGFATIKWFMDFLGKHSTNVFIYYRLALGALLLVLIGTGRLEPMAGLPPEAAKTSSK